MMVITGDFSGNIHVIFMGLVRYKTYITVITPVIGPWVMWKIPSQVSRALGFLNRRGPWDSANCPNGKPLLFNVYVCFLGG